MSKKNNTQPSSPISPEQDKLRKEAAARMHDAREALITDMQDMLKNTEDISKLLEDSQSVPMFVQKSEREMEDALREKFAEIRNGSGKSSPYFTIEEQITLDNILEKGDTSILQSEKAKENYTWRESITQFFCKLVGIEYKVMDINALDKNGKRPWEYLLHSEETLNLAKSNGVDIGLANADGKNATQRLAEVNNHDKEVDTKTISEKTHDNTQSVWRERVAAQPSSPNISRNV
ncbi:hypothetical protein [Candidatus Bandiella euplotis]|uniref:Uncharacterized protein n=1 Tax=Candidatus Bandiella euplotis TaxID=1664265 RepID=A0ABZ0UQ99_9RICK|nr:hypothetical protein [Candidatus Bandiella woodruffii]WPX97323.1 hypothetical protein Bandiella_01472 [Candidatus Bandiella woodruffii]